MAFIDRAIRDICEKEAEAQKRYSSSVVKSLQNRLSDLLVASWIEDMPSPPIFFLDGVEPRYRVNLTEGFYIELACAHGRPPTLGDGSINWEKVRKVLILRILK